MTAFGESVQPKGVSSKKEAAQATRAARATRFHQLCYPQHTCEWFVEGLDYCCNYWRYQFKRPLTPPPAPPPSPDVPQENCAPAEPPTRRQESAAAPKRTTLRATQRARRRGETDRCYQSRHDPSSPCRPKESCAPAEPPSSTTKAMMTNSHSSERAQRARRATDDRCYRATHRAQRLEARQALRSAAQKRRYRGQASRARRPGNRRYTANPERIAARINAIGKAMPSESPRFSQGYRERNWESCRRVSDDIERAIERS